MATKDSVLHILLADDDETDRELFIEGMNETGIKYTITEVANGEEVFTYLNSSAKKPHFIILDLNMPIKDGRQTLQELKASVTYKQIPVFIMSTSNAHFDVASAYEQGANLFLVKPHDFKGIVELFASLFTLFSKHVSL